MQLFTNNAVSSLASGVNATDNTLVLVAGEGAKFPAITGENFFLLTLTQGVGLESSWEIVKCTARSGDSLTVVRAQEGTAGQVWAAGSKVDLRVTAGTLEAKAPLANPTFTGLPSAPTAAVGTNTTQLATTAHVFAERAATATLTNKTISGANNTITVDGTNSVGFRSVPQNDQATAYTLVLSDAGKHIHKSGTSGYTVTIPSNASVAFPTGTAITFVNSGPSGEMTIAITSDVLRIAGAGTTGTKTLAAYGVATAIKVTSTLWMISGSGLT